MRLIALFLIIISQTATASFETFVPAWSKKCETRLTNKNMLYEVYHDCMDICMLKSRDHRKLKIKARQKECTNFTARFFNRQINVGTLEQRLQKGIKFCADQRIHRTGGHWLYISRKCKRLVCDYNKVASAATNPVCKNINIELNNGQILETYQSPTQQDIQRRNNINDNNKKTIPLEQSKEEPAPQVSTRKPAANSVKP